MSNKVKIDNLRSLAFGGISGVYAAVGSAATQNARILCITNNTDGDMIFSLDPTVVSGQLFVAKGSFKLFDFTTNIRPSISDDFVIAKGTIVYVKQVTAPSTGSVYVEYVYS